jgi:hypothetical protein
MNSFNPKNERERGDKNMKNSDPEKNNLKEEFLYSLHLVEPSPEKIKRYSDPNWLDALSDDNLKSMTKNNLILFEMQQSLIAKIERNNIEPRIDEQSPTEQDRKQD